MGVISSKTGKEKKYSVEEMKKIINEANGYILISLCAAKSGHAGGCLSTMDIAGVAYLDAMKHDPKNPDWEDRDRIFFSIGHKAPVLYAGLAISGYFDIRETVLLRKYDSPFQGHPHWLKLKGVEASTGSLGQGLSIAVGSALNAKLKGKDYRVYCIMGDGEQQEGQIWEAVMEASHYKLDNLVGIIDKNKLQIDGWVKDVMNIDPLADKYKSFGWHVIEINGHDIEQIKKAYDKAKTVKGKPTVIIADTVKGKGVSFMENVAGWHGKSPNYEELKLALKELGLENLPYDELLKKADEYQEKVTKEIEAKMPKFSKNYWWNAQKNMKADMEPTRFGFGKALNEKGSDERIVCLGADISGSIKISDFYESHNERKKRFLSMGIAEQSGTGVAAGLAKEGMIPVFGTYGVFACGRNLDQIRTTVCYGEFNVKIVGAHGGVSVGPDGATHQALEELYITPALPNMNVIVPCDSVETKKATVSMLFDVKGPCYIRFAREATPIITTESTPYVYGKANVIRYKGEKEKFIDAFETRLSSESGNEKEDIAIISCGPETAEAMRAAWILKEEYGIKAMVLNLNTIKPLDKEAIVKAAKETGRILTAEEHQVGGLGDKVAAAILTSDKVDRKVKMAMIGVQDKFGESGQPWELIKAFGLSAEFIAAKAKEMVGK